MNTIQRTLIALIAVVAVGGSFFTQKAIAQSSSNLSITVVDINEVLKNLLEAKKLQETLQAQAIDLQKQAEEREKKIKQLQADLEIFMPGSDSFAEKQNELEKEAIDFKVWRDYHQRRLERENVVELAALYKKIVGEIKALSESKGYDIVLFKDSFALPSNANRQQLTTIIQMRKVLYNSQRVDSTQLVIQRMNNAYKNRS